MKINLIIIFFSLIATNLFGSDSMIVSKFKTIDSLLNYKIDFPAVKDELNLLSKILKNQPENRQKTHFSLMYKNYELQYFIRIYDFKKGFALAYELLKDAELENDYPMIMEAHLQIAMISDHQKDFNNARKHLDEVYLIAIKKHLNDQMSTYYVRNASHYRFLKNMDSVKVNAVKAIKYAEKYDKINDLRDGYLLSAIALPEGQEQKAIEYYKRVYEISIPLKDDDYAYAICQNIAKKFLKIAAYDSAYYYVEKSISHIPGYNTQGDFRNVFSLKSEIFERMNRFDSAFFYQKLNFIHERKQFESDLQGELKIITEDYENDKKEITIKNKNAQLTLIFSILILISIGLIILWRKNRKINNQNSVINEQVHSLSKLLGQKETLLSELQHRVKNNLQHVSAILEMQKESISFNNVEELIRENQNRIQSMSALHTKLSETNNLNEVYLCAYLDSLCALVVNSYSSLGKAVKLEFECNVEVISIDKALPLGMICVELISNSMKHGFKDLVEGIIRLKICHDTAGLVNYTYHDNGSGIIDHKKESGLGMELINGFIYQLDGKAEMISENGFNLKFLFEIK